MNRAMIFPIRPNWVEQIFDGSKKFEFRTKLPKHLKQNMKIYIYETLGRKHVKKEMGYIVSTTYDGSGMIVGEFTVGAIYYLESKKYSYKHYELEKGFFGLCCAVEQFMMVSSKHDDFDREANNHVQKVIPKLQKIGLTNQKYAFEITNVVKYDAEWLITWFKNRPSYKDCTSEEWDYNQYVSDLPEKPIPKEAFYNWNKLLDLIKTEANDSGKKISLTSREKVLEGHYNLYKHDEITTEETKLCKIQSPPQAPLYVVGREGLK